MKYLIITILIITGCSSNNHKPQLDWSDNKASNSVAIKSYIPVGTSTSNALERMKEAGFDCEIHRDPTEDRYKGTTYVGEVGPPEHIACYKLKSGSTSKNWLVILIIDQTETISNYSVTIEKVKENKNQNKKVNRD